MNILIKEPCMENWQKMQAIEGGKFCDACKHRVHDLTGLSGNEIKKIKASNDGKICGRISVNLLREELVQSAVRNNYFYRLRIFSCAVLLSFGASLFTLQAANANRFIATAKSVFLKTEKDSVKNENVMIRGIVTDSKTKETLAFANVVALNADNTVIATVVADIEGVYELSLDPALYKKIRLEVIFVGYGKATVENITIDPNLKNMSVNVMLYESELELLGMIEYEVPPGSSIIIDAFQSGQRVSGNDYRRRPK